MKYIRTETGIYEVTNNKFGIIEENGKFKKFCENMGHTWYSELEVVKESENLEELCDKFVTLSKYSNRHYEYLTLKGAINMRKNLPFEVCEIYGAIWTSEGLIYVDKMNEEGELELI